MTDQILRPTSARQIRNTIERLKVRHQGLVDRHRNHPNFAEMVALLDAEVLQRRNELAQFLALESMTMETKSINFDIFTEDGTSSPKLNDLDQLRNVINGDAIIDERDEIRIVIDYPTAKTSYLDMSGQPITVARFAHAVGAFMQIAFRERELYGVGPDDELDGYWLEGADRRPDGTWHLLIGS